MRDAKIAVIKQKSSDGLLGVDASTFTSLTSELLERELGYDGSEAFSIATDMLVERCLIYDFEFDFFAERVDFSREYIVTGTVISFYDKVRRTRYIVDINTDTQSAKLV